MTSALAATLQIAAVVVILAIAYVPLGDCMAKAFASEHDIRAETVLYRLCRVDPRAQQSWVGYALSVLGFSAADAIFLYSRNEFRVNFR